MVMVGSTMARKPLASHAGAHHYSLIESWASLVSISAYGAWFALTCHWLSWFLLACWSCFLQRSQSLGLCTVHLMWFMHQCHVFFPLVCVLVRCSWLASSSILHLSSASMCLNRLFDFYGCFVHSHLVFSPWKICLNMLVLLHIHTWREILWNFLVILF